MPKNITIEVFNYDELSARPKERARDWYRSSISQSNWEIPVFKNFLNLLSLYNIEANRDCLAYCGFSYQGNGASFAGYYTFKATIADDIKAALPLEPKLWSYALSLTKIQKIYNNQITCIIRRDKTGEHEYAMNFEFRMADGSDLEQFENNHQTEFIEIMRNIARYLYETLEVEYNKITSQSEIERKIRKFNYTFLENGERFS